MSRTDGERQDGKQGKRPHESGDSYGAKKRIYRVWILYQRINGKEREMKEKITLSDLSCELHSISILLCNLRDEVRSTPEIMDSVLYGISAWIRRVSEDMDRLELEQEKDRIKRSPA